jgi:hypothetical protein
VQRHLGGRASAFGLPSRRQEELHGTRRSGRSPLHLHLELARLALSSRILIGMTSERRGSAARTARITTAQAGRNAERNSTRRSALTRRTRARLTPRLGSTRRAMVSRPSSGTWGMP